MLLVYFSRWRALSYLSWQAQFLENFDEFITGVQTNGGNILWATVKILVILLFARIILAALSKITRFVISSAKQKQDEKQEKRTTTLMTLFHSTSRYVIYFIAIIAILDQIGFHNVTSNLMMTAGIGSVAIGFGAQSLVKDVVTGIFMMFENQLSVGDFVKIGENEGFVEATAMRVTYLRTKSGEQVIIPNGTINRITNYSRGNGTAFITVSTAYEANTADIIKLLEEHFPDFVKKHEEKIEELPYVVGITQFSASSVDIGIGCKTKPMQQVAVERELRLFVKELFDGHGIEFPYQHIDVHTK